MIRQAVIEDDRWPFHLDVMRKATATPRLVDYRAFAEQAHVAETMIGPALEVLDAPAVLGRDILVFDDVFTGGLTLREVARKLRDAGAASVSGIVLARAPFRSGP